MEYDFYWTTGHMMAKCSPTPLLLLSPLFEVQEKNLRERYAASCCVTPWLITAYLASFLQN